MRSIDLINAQIAADTKQSEQSDAAPDMQAVIDKLDLLNTTMSAINDKLDTQKSETEQPKKKTAAKAEKKTEKEEAEDGDTE